MWLLQTEIIKKITTYDSILTPSTTTTEMNVHFGIATDYVRTLTQSIRHGVYNKAKDGYHQTTPPFGYKVKGELRVPNEYFQIVQKMFQWYAVDMLSNSQIAKELNELGIKTRENNFWSHSKVEKILKNPFYAGRIVVNIAHNGIGKIDAKGKHEPAVSLSIFQKCQDIREGKLIPRTAKHSYTLAKKIKCECGSFLVSYRPKNKNNVYLECKKCPTAFIVDQKIRKTITERIVFDSIDSLIEGLEFSQDFVESLKTEVKTEIKNARKEKEKFKKESAKKIQEIETKIEKLEDAYLDSVLAKEELLARKSKLQKEKAGFIIFAEETEALNSEEIEEVLENTKEILDIFSRKKDKNNDFYLKIIELFFESIKIQDQKLVFEFSELGKVFEIPIPSDPEIKKHRTMNNSIIETLNKDFNQKNSSWYWLRRINRTNFDKIKETQKAIRCYR